MSWNVFILLLILAFAGTVDSKYLGVPNAIKDFEVSSDNECDSCAQVVLRCYEYDTVSFKVEFVPVQDGESFFAFANRSIDKASIFFRMPSITKEFVTQVKGLKMNETYVVRVFAFNKQGQSHPSPAVIFSFDRNRVPVMDRHFLPTAPREIRLASDRKNGTEVSWKKVKYREDQTYTMSPVEYIIRYGDNKNTSLWKEMKTNNTWIILDDLKYGIEYSAYVVAREENRTSCRSFTFPIIIGEDMAGLPEPVLTIEPADKNRVFACGDSMTIKCLTPPNTLPFTPTVLFIGRHINVTLLGYRETLIFNTTASKDIETASCSVGGDRGLRKSKISWKVKETLDGEQSCNEFEKEKLPTSDSRPPSGVSLPTPEFQLPSNKNLRPTTDSRLRKMESVFKNITRRQ